MIKQEVIDAYKLYYAALDLLMQNGLYDLDGILKVLPAIAQERLADVVDEFSMQAIKDVAERIDSKRSGKYDDFDGKAQASFIDLFEKKYPGLYDLMVEIVESVSREQLPEVQTAFCVVLSQHLTYVD